MASRTISRAVGLSGELGLPTSVALFRRCQKEPECSDSGLGSQDWCVWGTTPTSRGRQLVEDWHPGISWHLGSCQPGAEALPAVQDDGNLASFLLLTISASLCPLSQVLDGTDSCCTLGDINRVTGHRERRNPKSVLQAVWLLLFLGRDRVWDSSSFLRGIEVDSKKKKKKQLKKK